MFDFLKKPIVIAFVLVAIVVALIWSSISSWQENRHKTEVNDQINTETAPIVNLANVDASEFDDQLNSELGQADAKAQEADSKNQLSAVVIDLDSLEINSGTNRYIYTSSKDIYNNWTVAFSQATSNYIRAKIPKDDYMGDLAPIEKNLWKFNYVTTLQIAEQNGGLSFREKNDLISLSLVLKHGEPNNWLIWTVEYKSKNDISSIRIDANSGKVLE